MIDRVKIGAQGGLSLKSVSPHKLLHPTLGDSVTESNTWSFQTTR